MAMAAWVVVPVALRQAAVGGRLPAPQRPRGCSAKSAARRPATTRLSTEAADVAKAVQVYKDSLREWGLTPRLTGYREGLNPAPEGYPLRIEYPAIVALPDFLSPAECDEIIASQKGNVNECDLYLNARVNAEQSEGGLSTEADELLKEQGVGSDELDATMKSGFRTQVDPSMRVLQDVVLPRLQYVMDLEDRRVVHEEGLWIRPNQKTLVVRDQTVVHYCVGEGVAPHIDGKDATLLIYLNDVPSGGSTTFSEVGLSVAPKRGMALLYSSKKHLLHYAEQVRQGEKWVMQLLVDFKVKPGEMAIDHRTGRAL